MAPNIESASLRIPGIGITQKSVENFRVVTINSCFGLHFGGTFPKGDAQEVVDSFIREHAMFHQRQGTPNCNPSSYQEVPYWLFSDDWMKKEF